MTNGLDIGITIPDSTSIDGVVKSVRAAADRGFHSAWMAQIFGIDTLTALAIAGREVPDITIGSAVIPTYPRHPMMLAAQARTVQQASNGRFVLGIGLSHQIVIEGILGIPWTQHTTHVLDYLAILGPLCAGEPVSHEGATLTAKVTLDIPLQSSPPVPVLVAALGPNLLALAGSMADGTITWMTGPDTIRKHVVPLITAAAAEAGRPSPQVVMSLPVTVTDDVDDARAQAAKLFSIYGFLPSYRAMLDREGVGGPGDVAIVGTEDEVRTQIEAVFDAGATTFTAAVFGNADRTQDLLASLL